MMMKLAAMLLLASLGLALAATPVEKVNMYIGTGGIGFGVGAVDMCAQVPFGAWRGGPDTSAIDDLWVSFAHDAGYYYPDAHIRAFSHTRLVGAGVADYGNIGIMPTNSITNTTIIKNNYRSEYSHEKEQGQPGVYRVHLDTHNVFSELAAAGSHAGVHRHSHAHDAPERVLLIDVCHNADKGGLLHTDTLAVRNATVQVDAEHGIVTGSLRNHGSLSGRSPSGGVEIYFHIRVYDSEMQAPIGVGVWEDGVARDHVLSGESDKGSLGAYFRFGKGTKGKLGGGEIICEVGISFVSAEQAELNAHVQIANLTFDEIAARATDVWNAELSTLSVSEATPADTVAKMYTALYHTLVSPTLMTEVNGAYPGFDQKNHVYTAGEYGLYSDMSIWDIHRSQVPWLNLVRPNIGNALVRSLEVIARDGGDLPKWPLANVYSGCMTGQHSFIMLIDAVHKNLSQGLDLDFLFALMTKEATTGTPHSARDDLKDYLTYNYVPNDHQSNGASLTLEYAFDDWAVWAMGQHLGQNASTFAQRALNYRNVWDSKHQFMCPRDSNGTTHCRHETQQFWLNKDYTEGDAWQWSFVVPHDPLGLVELFGSNEKFTDKLNECFARSVFDSSNALPNPYYWAGNEPDLLHVWLFPFGKRPDLTQKWSRWLVENKYDNTPKGIPGNDDYGTMSAWLAFASFGFYPLAGFDLYIVGSPAMPAANITLGGLNTIQMVAHNWTPKTLYVSNVKLNGTPLPGPVLTHAQLVAGGLLEFEMSETATKWGADYDWRSATNLWPPHQ